MDKLELLKTSINLAKVLRSKLMSHVAFLLSELVISNPIKMKARLLIISKYKDTQD